jgi:hypothetical protein
MPSFISQNGIMKTKTLLLFTIVALVGIIVAQCYAATVPANTVLVVKTLDPISSVDSPGKRFMTQLERNVSVNGKVILPAGTKVSGKVVTSRRMTHSSDPLSVNLTDVQFGGRSVAIKTTRAFKLDQYTSSRGVGISRHSYVVAAGKKMDFQLAAPLNL